jgi:hypothetical protein
VVPQLAQIQEISQIYVPFVTSTEGWRIRTERPGERGTFMGPECVSERIERLDRLVCELMREKAIIGTGLRLAEMAAIATRGAVCFHVGWLSYSGLVWICETVTRRGQSAGTAWPWLTRIVDRHLQEVIQHPHLPPRLAGVILRRSAASSSILQHPDGGVEGQVRSIGRVQFLSDPVQ